MAIINKFNSKITQIILLAITLLITIILSIWVFKFILTILDRKKGAVIILTVLVVVILIFLGQQFIIYLLSVAWIIPIGFASIKGIPLTHSFTAWEALLYSCLFFAFITGHIRLFDNQRDSFLSVKGMWFGLIVISFGSLLALGEINPQYGAGNFRYAAMNPLALFLLASSLITGRKQLYAFALSVAAGAAAYLIFQVSQGVNLFMGRMQIQMVNPFEDAGIARFNALGLVASSLMPLILCYALRGKNLLLKWLGIALFLALAVTLVATISRGTMISCLVSCLVMMILAARAEHRMQVLKLGVTLTVIGFLTYIYAVPIFFQNYDAQSINVLLYRLGSFFSLFHEDSSLTSRMDLWSHCFSRILDNPLGIGYGTMMVEQMVWEHNMFVMVMNGGGIIGLIGLLVFCSSYMIMCLQAIKRSNGFLQLLCIAALGGMINFIIAGLTIELLYPTYAESSLLVLALGFCACRQALSEANNKQGVLLRPSRLKNPRLSFGGQHVR